jgi:DDE family transposase
MLPQSYPNYKTVHRRFQTWCRDEVLRRVLTDVANELRDRGALDEEECFIDATFVMAKGGGLEIGATKRGKGMKIMAIVDRHGLPLSVSTHAANHHEVRLVQLCFDFYMIEAKPENLIGDRAYDTRGSAGSSFVGSTTPTISLALSNLPASLSSSNDFEIGSSHSAARSICLVRHGKTPCGAARVCSPRSRSHLRLPRRSFRCGARCAVGKRAITARTKGFERP